MPYTPSYRFTYGTTYRASYTDKGVVIAFQPTDISDLKFWLDGSDITTLFEDSARTTPVTADGDPVGGWADKSGQSHHVGQTVTAAKPTYKTSVQNGLSAVLGDGGDNIFNASAAVASDSDQTLFAVANTSSNETVGTIFNDTNTSSIRTAMFVDARTANKLNTLIDTDSDPAITLANLADIGTEFVQQTFRRAGSAIEVWKSGVSQDTGTITGDPQSHYTRIFTQHGGATRLTGHIAEIVMYSRALTPTERSQVESYLISKWNIT